MGEIPSGNWALVKPTITSAEYMPVQVTRKTKRFAYVQTPAGKEWRYTARGLWDGFPSEEAAYAELDRMRADARAFLKGPRVAS